MVRIYAVIVRNLKGYFSEMESKQAPCVVMVLDVKRTQINDSQNNSRIKTVNGYMAVTKSNDVRLGTWH